MMRFVSVLGLAGLLVSPSFGLAATGRPAPADDNVIVIAPTKVDVPDKLPGDCQVRGVVRAVWQGRAYRIGQAIQIAVPCASPKPVFDDRPATRRRSDFGAKPSGTPVNPLVLAASTLGYAHVDDYGGLIWTPTKHRYGNWGRISGYVVGGAKLPLIRNAA